MMGRMVLAGAVVTVLAVAQDGLPAALGDWGAGSTADGALAGHVVNAGESNGASEWPAVSGDGRFVVFNSAGSNLVPGDINRADDIFVRDRQTGTTLRVSVSSRGQQANGASSEPTISADGRYVAFKSSATNLTPNDRNGRDDIFVHDMVTGANRRVSVSSTGRAADRDSGEPAISADGRIVAFVSGATNLVQGDTNWRPDVFIHNLSTGNTRRVSVSSTGTQSNGKCGGPVISADGRIVAFWSLATNLVAKDTNQSRDIFVRNRTRGVTKRASLSSSETQANAISYSAAISADGRYVAFDSLAWNLVPDDHNGRDDVFIRDRAHGTTRRVTLTATGGEANRASSSPAISADGSVIAFESDASNLVPVDTNGAGDIFARRLPSGSIQRVSVASSGTQANDASAHTMISADGRFVAFESGASNLVGDDTNGLTIDILLHDLTTGTTERVSIP